jgi:hypothetical protein
MNENRLDIQTKLTKQTHFQAARVLLFRQLTLEKEKAYASHFLKFLLANPHCTHLVLPSTQANASQNQKGAIFSNPQMKIKS